MTWLAEKDAAVGGMLRPIVGAPAVRWVALLGLGAANLEGGFNKLTGFSGAIAEIQQFGLSPRAPLAAATIAGAWRGGPCPDRGVPLDRGTRLAGLTLMATFIANRFWEMARPERSVGGFILVAWHDIREKSRNGQIEPGPS